MIELTIILTSLLATMVLIPATDAGWREAIPEKTMMKTNGRVDGFGRLHLSLPSSITKVCGPNSTFARFVRGILKNEGRTAKEIKRVMRQFFPSHSQIKKFSVGFSKKSVKTYYKSRQAILLRGFWAAACNNAVFDDAHWKTGPGINNKIAAMKLSRAEFIGPDLKTALSYNLSDETLATLQSLYDDQKTLCTVAKIFLDKRQLKFENIQLEMDKGSFGENLVTEENITTLFRTQAIRRADKRLDGNLKPYLEAQIGTLQQNFVGESLIMLTDRHSSIFSTKSNLYQEMQELWDVEHGAEYASLKDLKELNEINHANAKWAWGIARDLQPAMRHIYDEGLWTYEVSDKPEVEEPVEEVEEIIEPDIQEEPAEVDEIKDLLSKLNLF